MTRLMLMGTLAIIGIGCVLCLSVSAKAALLIGDDYSTDFSQGGTSDAPHLPKDAFSRWNAWLNSDLGAQIMTEPASGMMAWSWGRKSGDKNGYIVEVSVDVCQGDGETQFAYNTTTHPSIPDEGRFGLLGASIGATGAHPNYKRLSDKIVISPEDDFLEIVLVRRVPGKGGAYWDNLTVNFEINIEGQTEKKEVLEQTIQETASAETKVSKTDITDVPWVDVRSYASLSSAVMVIGREEKTLLIPNQQEVTSNIIIPANITLWFIRGSSLNISETATVTIHGSIDAGLSQIFKGKGKVSLGTGVSDFFAGGNVAEVYSEWWGTKADGTTDCTEALKKAVKVCGSTRTLRLVDGVYRISSVVEAICPIKGNSPYTSIIKNTGTGDGLYLPGTYFKTWMNFAVEGNPNSRDGITLYGKPGDSNCYSNFINVWSYKNGRHGLYHRNAWATKYIECKFSENGGLGIFLDTQIGDPGTHNGVSFINCESRWNGGKNPDTTYNDDKGGVKIAGAAMVTFIGGIYESNNAWGFIISNQGHFATRNIHIKNVYMEHSPTGAKVGGLFYLGGIWEYVTVEQSWLGYGTEEGKTGYCFYVNDRPGELDHVTFEERDNFLVAGGPGVRSYGATHAKSKPLVSEMFGDISSPGKPVTTILKVSDDGTWIISGSIHVTGDSGSAVYPFIVSRNKTSKRSVTVGEPIIGAVRTAPQVAFIGDELQVKLAGNQTAFVKLEEQVAVGNEPKTFELSPVLFGVMMRRR